MSDFPGFKSSIIDHGEYQAVVARCRELENELKIQDEANEIMTKENQYCVQRILKLEAALAGALSVVDSSKETACEHHWMPATQAGSLAIIGRGCSKCGAWETSPEPNYRFQEPSNLPSQSMTIGAHPGGGPCIHVWALTNRDAVENGRCGICGQSVANRGVKQ